MKSIGLMIALLFTIVIRSFCQQGINNNWIMGYDSNFGFPFGSPKFDFYNVASPTITLDSLEMEFRHSHTNISDSGGNLLFYTNGFYLADVTNDTMQNGSGLNPSLYTTAFSNGFLIPQANVIIQKPGSGHLYYLFHSTLDTMPNPTHSKHLYYSVIDMNLNGGIGGVTIKNHILLTDSMNAGKLAMCKHANGRDWWLMVQKVNSNTFLKFLITPSTILGPYAQSIGSQRVLGAGQAGFSSDGKKYALFWKNSNGTGSLEIFDFNRCNATLSNAVNINIPYENGFNVGFAFSPNSNLLYVSNVFNVYQFDLNAANIAASQITVATYDSFMSLACSLCTPFQALFGLAQLAPDGKIYITTGNSTVHFHTIDSPDVAGVGCIVNQHSLQIPRYYFNTLPNHPNYFLGCDTSCTTCLTGLPHLNPPPRGGLKALPNPTSGVFTLQFNVRSITGELEIVDVMGQVVYRDYVAPWSQFKKVGISEVANGIYVCRIKRGDEIEMVKVIKE